MTICRDEKDFLCTSTDENIINNYIIIVMLHNYDSAHLKKIIIINVSCLFII